MHVVIFVLILFVGFFTSSETAFISLSRLKLRRMVEEKRNVVKLTFEKEQLSLVVDNPELGESNDFIDIDFEEDEPIKIAFNCKYLLDVLRNYDTDKVRFELKQSISAALIKPEGNDKYLALIMPIQIKE